MPWVRGWHRPLLVISRLGTDQPIVIIDANLSVNPKTVQFVDDTNVIVKNPILLILKKLLTWL
jgi:hypothetical protein